MTLLSRLKQPRVFIWSIYSGLTFVLLTFVGMYFYVGGNSANPEAPTYSFFYNFFSEIGLTVAYGQPNTIAAILFFIAMIGSGASLILFFIAFTQFFTEALPVRIFSLIGTVFGILSGISFIGVGFTPADVLLDPHVWFVFRAFQFFPLAVICYIIAIFLSKTMPHSFGYVFVVFALCLIAYLYLLTYGPSGQTDQGLLIQVTGQKLVAYASIISVLIQGWQAYKLADERQLVAV
ncbi:MAG: hypothetical protein AAF614_28855 [Chloroflexota bacterium]